MYTGRRRVTARTSSVIVRFSRGIRDYLFIDFLHKNPHLPILVITDYVS